MKKPSLFGILTRRFLSYYLPILMFSFRKKKAPEPVIRQRKEHNVSRKNIPSEALTVLYRLSDAGFVSYLVGGGVRDLLLGRDPKDFDVATDAQPHQIKKLFRNARLIGRRFRLALICFRERQIETCTFRREPDVTEVEDGMRPGALYRSEDNLFGTPEQDALRRDFTVNGLFYDIKTFAIIDYVGGLEDLKRKVLRSIGDPNVRFREDPVRMMRAVRFAAKLDFDIHRDSEKAILRHHAEIGNASPPRLFEEVSRLFNVGAAKAFALLSDLKLMGDLLPALQSYIEESGRRRSPLWSLLEAFDASTSPVAEDPALRFATLLYPLYQAEQRKAEKEGRQIDAEQLASDLVGSVLINPFVARTWCPPRNLCEDVALILAAQTHFDYNPAPTPRSSRGFKRGWLPAALLLFRLRTEVNDGAFTSVETWEAFAAKYNLTGNARSSEDIFRDGRRPRGEGRDPSSGAPSGRSSSRRRRIRRGPRRGPSPSSPSSPA